MKSPGNISKVIISSEYIWTFLKVSNYLDCAVSRDGGGDGGDRCDGDYRGGGDRGEGEREGAEGAVEEGEEGGTILAQGRVDGK